jgi:hypothetical protein
MNPTPHRKLIFLHIPKTGGSTLRKIIDRQYPTNETLRCYYQKQGISLQSALEEMNGVPQERATQVNVILGHVGYGIHEHLPWTCSYFTILRDPVERFLSGYYHILRDSDHKFHAEVQGMTIKEFISKEELKVEAARVNAVNALDNLQTRLLSGEAVDRELSDNVPPYEPCTSAMLEQAKKNLEKCVAVGLSERFDDSLMLFRQRLGWSNAYYVRSNVGWNRKPNERPSAETIRCLEEYNQMDLELYSYAKRRFESAIAEQGFMFKSRLASYKLLNRTYAEARRASGAIEKRVLQKASGN